MEIIIKINGQVATCDQPAVLTSSAQVLTAVFEFDEHWDGMMKTAIFTRNGVSKNIILQENKCVVPTEVIKNGGFIVSVLGMVDDKVLTTTNQCAVVLNLSGYVPGITVKEPSKDVYQQIMELFQEHTDLAREVLLNKIHSTEITDDGELVITYVDGDRAVVGKVIGPQGDRGLQGDPGPQGPRGFTGATGATGPQGPRGLQGLQGPAGRDGTSLYISDVYATLDELKTTYPEGDGTNMYMVLADSNCYVWSELAVAWTSVGQLQGPEGPQGETGPQGPQGIPGTNGLDGQDGAPGADGKSAYQVAVDGGYTGEEEEFNRKMSQLGDCQVTANMVTELNQAEDKYPSAKAVYDAIEAIKKTVVSTTLLASGWVAGAYDFSATYPAEEYDLSLSYDGDRYTAATKEAFDNAGMVGSASANKFVTTGTTPAVDIPIILEVIPK